MKTAVILFFAIALLVTPAFAQQAGRNSRASQAGPNVAKLLNAYNRMMRANKQSGAAALPGQTKSPFNPLSNVNPTAPGASSLPATPGFPPGDRPFDANMSANNPFGPTAPSPSSLSNPSVAFGPGVDAFSPGQLTVNPFIPAIPSPASPFLVGPQALFSSQGMYPGDSMNTGQNAPVIRKAPQLKLTPLEGFMPWNTPLSSSPYSSPAASDPLSVYKSPYSLNSPFSGSFFQPLASP
jgi:hypothetical protein